MTKRILYTLTYYLNNRIHNTITHWQTPHFNGLVILQTLVASQPLLRYYRDVTWASWRLRSKANWLFVQRLVQVSENKNKNTKTPQYRSLVRGIYQWIVDSPHTGPIRKKAFPSTDSIMGLRTRVVKFMGPTWGPPGSCRPQMGPMLVPWILVSGCRKFMTERWLIRWHKKQLLQTHYIPHYLLLRLLLRIWIILKIWCLKFVCVLSPGLNSQHDVD